VIWLPLALAGDAMVEARRAEREGAPHTEWVACGQVLAEEQGTRDAATCERRLAWLAERRDRDGSFTSLTQLERARRGKGGIAGLDRADVPQVVRWEALLWSEGGVAVTGRLWHEVPRDHPLFPRVAAAHVAALVAEGRLADAQAVEASADRPRSARPREGVALALQERGRRWIGWGAGLAVGAFVLGSAPLAVRGWRTPGARPQGLLVLAAVFALCAAVAGAWDLGAGVTVLWLAPPVAVLHVLSAGALLARPGARWIRGGAAFATLGAIWWVLVWRDALPAVGL